MRAAFDAVDRAIECVFPFVMIACGVAVLVACVGMAVRA